MKEICKKINKFFKSLLDRQNLASTDSDKKTHDLAKSHVLSNHVKNSMPGIKGSNILWFMKGFRKFDIECGKLKEIDDGYQMDVMSPSYSYYITANKNFEILSFQLSISDSLPTDEILECCCELNYNSENQKEAKRLLINKNHAETEAIIVGDAYFELSTDLKGVVFTIKVLGFDQYVNTLLQI